jgi:K+ transporter
MNDPIEMIISLTSCLLLIYMIPAAAAAKRPAHKMSIILLALAFLIQMMGPLSESIPDLGWPTMLLTLALAFVVTAWRQPLWKMVKEEFLGKEPSEPSRS